MPELDRNRLAKLLRMIGSAHDGEALNAARMAHTLVRTAGLTWDEILDKAPTIILPPSPPAPIFWRTSRAGNLWATLNGLYVVIINREARYSVGYRDNPSDELEWASGFRSPHDAQAWAECFLREEIG